MRLTKRQLKRIIREEYTRLKRRGLINETRPLAVGAGPDTEFSAVCESDFGIPCGPNSPMFRLFQKVYDCQMRMTPAQECASRLSPDEMELMLEDFINVLVECQNPECQDMVNYCYDVEQYI